MASHQTPCIRTPDPARRTPVDSAVASLPHPGHRYVADPIAADGQSLRFKAIVAAVRSSQLGVSVATRESVGSCVPGEVRSKEPLDRCSIAGGAAGGCVKRRARQRDLTRGDRVRQGHQPGHLVPELQRWASLGAHDDQDDPRPDRLAQERDRYDDLAVLALPWRMWLPICADLRHGRRDVEVPVPRPRRLSRHATSRPLWTAGVSPYAIVAQVFGASRSNRRPGGAQGDGQRCSRLGRILRVFRTRLPAPALHPSDPRAIILPDDFPFVTIDATWGQWWRNHNPAGAWWFASSDAPNVNPDDVGRLDLPSPYGTCYLAWQVTTTALEAMRLNGLTPAGVQAAAAQRHMSAMALDQWHGKKIADFTSARLPELGVPLLRDLSCANARPWAEAAHAAGFHGILYALHRDPEHRPGLALFGKAGAMEKPGAQGAGQPLVVRYLREAMELINQDESPFQSKFGGDPLAE